MADDDTTASTETPAKPARRRATTPAKAAAAKPRTPRAKAATADDAPAAKTVKAKAPPKPRSTKRSTAAKPRTATRAKTAVRSATDKVGGRWGAAAIAGGLAVAGAAAALFTLRGSSAEPTDPATKKAKGAHQPDGKDSSKSFDAKIADENTVPE